MGPNCQICPFDKFRVYVSVPHDQNGGIGVIHPLTSAIRSCGEAPFLSVVGCSRPEFHLTSLPSAVP